MKKTDLSFPSENGQQSIPNSSHSAFSWRGFLSTCQNNMGTKSFLKRSPKGKQASVTGMSAGISQTLRDWPTRRCSTWTFWKQWLTHWTRFPVAQRIHDNSWKESVESGQIWFVSRVRYNQLWNKNMLSGEQTVRVHVHSVQWHENVKVKTTGKFWIGKP